MKILIIVLFIVSCLPVKAENAFFEGIKSGASSSLGYVLPCPVRRAISPILNVNGAMRSKNASGTVVAGSNYVPKTAEELNLYNSKLFDSNSNSEVSNANTPIILQSESNSNVSESAYVSDFSLQK